MRPLSAHTRGRPRPAGTTRTGRRELCPQRSRSAEPRVGDDGRRPRRCPQDPGGPQCGWGRVAALPPSRPVGAKRRGGKRRCSVQPLMSAEEPRAVCSAARRSGARLQPCPVAAHCARSSPMPHLGFGPADVGRPRRPARPGGGRSAWSAAGWRRPRVPGFLRLLSPFPTPQGRPSRRR